jgi:hypothetical protein
LETWCKEWGIEIHLTAPYSPSQNGVAEWMNCTLAELGRAMLIGNDLPEFLWEYSIMHATYLHNCTYTKHLPNSTLYQGWHNEKLNVAHLQEFGAPVWVLLQGQKEDRKMLPKSKHRVYVGFDEGAQAVKYYNAETHNILTSQNFCHINPPVHPTPPEPIELTPNMVRKGESEGDMLPMGVTGFDDTTHNLEPKRKWKRNEVEGNVDINEPQKTRGICTNYKLLHDPFPEEEEEETFLTMEEVYTIIAGNELTSLKEAKNSLEWPEWE